MLKVLYISESAKKKLSLYLIPLKSYEILKLGYFAIFATYNFMTLCSSKIFFSGQWL